MNYFDTDVQALKYHVLSEVAKLAYNDALTTQNLMEVATIIVPDGEAKMRCCIYKERAIVNERVKLALGGDDTNPNVVEVLKTACDECPVDGIQVTDACRGCIAHKCLNACPKNAISMVNRRAVIDKNICIECGRCLTACSYSAIVKHTRPCVNACKTDAISIDPNNHKAVINEDKCISCGSCVYKCPFGAIMDKSYITKVIKMIRESNNNENYKVYAIVAPSLVSQYANIPTITTEKAVSAIKLLGFHSVIEAALGADMVASMEAEELVEKGFLTSSCCPAFVEYIKKNYPAMTQHISHNLSPMTQMAKMIKEIDPTAKTVFIGPCIAKKYEGLQEQVSSYVDCVLTFEEMQAMFHANDIKLDSMEETPLDNASYFGRIFATAGGLSIAVGQALKEKEIDKDQFECKPISCNGIAECKVALLKASKGILAENFIEGMACENGCIGGPACLSHSSKDKMLVYNYGKLAIEKTIADAISVFEK